MTIILNNIKGRKKFYLFCFIIFFPYILFMSIKLNKETYQKIIDKDIEELIKHFPEKSLEKEHIKLVLQWSVDILYPKESDINEDL